MRSSFLMVCAIALAACDQTLNATEIEDTIREGIVKQGGTSLESVICPTNIQPAAGKGFECVGVLESGSGMAIAVEQQEGKIAWDFASVKGLLNMPKLQAAMQERLEREVGPASLDCGSSTYRSVKPGEVFECKVLKRSSAIASEKIQLSSRLPEKPQPNQNQKAKIEPDTIQVTIEPSGDVSWQRIIQVQIAQAAASSRSSGPSARAVPQAESNQPSLEKAASMPLSQGKSAEEFLNQPGATDDFE